MKNFGFDCEICLFNPFIPSSPENDIGQMAAARVGDHTSEFDGIGEYFP